MKIGLVDITEDNRKQCFALKVADNQMQYIASNEDSWKAAQENEKVARPFAIYCDKKIVGFTMLAFDEEYEDPNDRYWLWRFMIDERLQGNGYGTATALSMYRKAGFQDTGKMNDDEIVLQLCL